MATDDVSVLLTLFVTSHALATLLRLHPHIFIETKDVITSKFKSVVHNIGQGVTLSAHFYTMNCYETWISPSINISYIIKNSFVFLSLDFAGKSLIGLFYFKCLPGQLSNVPYVICCP
jgi:hypothetical protein